MVARITAANPRYAALRETAQELVQRADSLREALLAARWVDEEAYLRVVRASALPRAGDRDRAERDAALQTALAGAAEAPLQSAQLALETLRLSEAALAMGNRHLVSDVGCAAAFAAAALQAAAYNVRVNHRFLRDRALVDRQALELLELEREGDEIAARVRAALAPS